MGDSIGRNVVFSFAAQIVTSAATAALTLYLVRALSVEEFGALSIALGLGTLILLPGDFGVSASAGRFIAEHRGDWPAVGAVLRNALKVKLVTSAVLALALLALADPIASAYGAHGLTWTLRGMALVVFFQSFYMLFTGTFIALGRVSLNLRIITMESLVETFFAALLVLLGAGAAGAAFGRAIGYSAGAGFGIVLLVRLAGAANLRREAARAASPVGAKRILGYGSALVIIDGAYALLAPVGTLLIGALLNAKSVAVFSAPVRFITFLHYPGYSVAAGIAPRLARGKNSEPDVKALADGLRWIILIQTVLVAPTVIWAGPIVDILLGPGYEKSADVLAGLAPFTFTQGFAPLLSLSVNYLGEARRRVPIAVATLLISVGIDFALIPSLGIDGATIATDVAYTFYVLGHLWICKRLLDLPLRPVVRDLARALVAAAAMCGVMALFGTEDLGVVAILLGGAAGVIVYVAMLLGLRAVTVAELRGARGFVAAKLGRR